MAALNPPFMANDMQGLYNRVIKGQYPNIPSTYSQDLANIIRSMLQVNPSVRPSCATILEMPPVLRHINPGRISQEEEEKNQLLNTIKFDPNAQILNKKLPEANYEKKERVGSAGPSKKVPEQRGRVSSAKGDRPAINELQMMQDMLINPRQNINNRDPDNRQIRPMPRQEPDYRGPRIAPRPEAKEVFDPRYQRPNQHPLAPPEPHPMYKIPPKQSPSNYNLRGPVDPSLQPQPYLQPQRVGAFVLDSPSHRQEQIPDYRNQIRQYDNKPSNDRRYNPMPRYDAGRPGY
mmetsp:Transcript_9440/g.9411  ORF Transcript_9440/g.9411 Transcript_9440/m.9411 type:complete len:290 (+) Transcript_9440:612-1481(+)